MTTDPASCAQRLLEDRARVGAGDRRHAVEADAKAALEQRPDAREVEQAGHQLAIVRDRVDDLDHGRAEPALALPVERDVGRVEGPVLPDLPRALIDRLGHLLGRRAAVRAVVLDAEVAVRAAGIVAGREDDAAERLVLADHGGGRGRRQQPALADQDAAEAVGGGHLEDGLDGAPVVVAAVAADHERAAREALERIEHRLDEVLEIVRLLEHPDLLAQAGGARALVLERRGRDGGHGHRKILRGRRRPGPTFVSSVAGPSDENHRSVR